MGQKVHPRILRSGPTLINTWSSLYYSKNSGTFIVQDYKIREFLRTSKYSIAGISNIGIQRPSNKSIILNIDAKKPKLIIGKNGQDIDELRTLIMKLVGIQDIYINVNEIRIPDLDANLVGQNIAAQLEKRAAFRRVMKKSIDTAMKFGAKGIKIRCAGRLNGAEIATSEVYKKGKVPLHTLRADIDYAIAKAHTTYGVIGIKVWIYKGDK